ncbi:MAG: helix-turn-helix transcriptional regulator [Proteobacteria bacterium]|nr:helix-turn-helix transcriptional regulator [Pseudomonadota bacterium]
MSTWHGRQVTAARALAGLTITELASEAGVTERTIRRIEAAETITIAERLTYGAFSLATWEKVVTALFDNGVELFPPTGTRGPGVRWVRNP